MSDLLGDSLAAETSIAPLHVDDGRDELGGWSFRAGLTAVRRRGKKQAVFAINQCAVELEQCCRLDQRAKLRNPARIHEQRGQSEHEAIERGQIRCALPGSITDQKLVFEQKRLCGDGAYAARAEQLCAGDQQVDGQDDEIAHRANGTIATSGGKTAQRGRIASHYEFAPHTLSRLPTEVRGTLVPLYKF